MVEDSLEIMRQARADRDLRAMIRATPTPAPLPGHPPGVVGGPISPIVPHAVMEGRVPSAAPVSSTAIEVYTGRGTEFHSVENSEDEAEAPYERRRGDEAALYVSGGP